MRLRVDVEELLALGQGWVHRGGAVALATEPLIAELRSLPAALPGLPALPESVEPESWGALMRAWSGAMAHQGAGLVGAATHYRAADEVCRAAATAATAAS